MYYIHRATFAPGIIHWEYSGLGWEDDSTVGILDPSLTSVQPNIMTDWGFSGTITDEVQPASVEPNQSLDPILSTKAVKETNVAEHNLSIGQTVGNVGTVPVMIGPSSIVVVGLQTLKPGGQAAAVDGTPISLAPSGTAVIVGGTSFPLSQHPKLEQKQTVGTLVTVPVVLKSSSIIVIGMQTLHPEGAPVTIAPSTNLSLLPSATALVIVGITSLLTQVIDLDVESVVVPTVN